MGSTSQAGELVAIVSADIVGSTQVLSSRGVNAAIEMQEAARSAVERVCGSGDILEYRGDGSLIGFRSASAAIDAAWRLRDDVADEDFQLRIAVTLEQPRSDEILNVRMQQRSQSFEAQCQPGSIVTDDRIRRAVRGHHETAFEILDEDVYELVAFSSNESRDQEASAVRTVLFSEPTTGSALADRTAADITRALAESHGGLVINANGGRFMTTFRSCDAAMRAADAIHAEAASRRARNEPDVISFRIAASVGEVIETDDDSFGIAVIEAARLLAVADANSTLISLDVAHLAGLNPAKAQRRGFVSLKGLDDAVDLVWLEHDGRVPPLLELPQPLSLGRERAFVGRQDHVTFLHERLDATLEGTPSAVVIRGEEGIGKTRLVTELARSAHDDGVIVLHGACENDPRAPFAPIVEALRRASGIDPAIDSALRDGAGPLGSLFQLAPSRSTAEAAPGQLEQFGAVADALGRLCEARPVLLVLDDIQWASNDMSRLLADVLGTSKSMRLLIVFTQRSESSLESDLLSELLSDVHHGVRRHQLSLSRLDDADVAAMIEARTASGLPRQTDGLASAISNITGGNPLYVEEFLTHLISTHVIVDEPGVGWSLAIDVAELSPPDSIVDLMSRRIDRLGVDACQVLGVAALMGAYFDLEVLASVTGHDIGHILNIVESAATASLVRPADHEGDRAFSDEISRAAFLRHVPEGRKALIHEQLASAIEHLRPEQLDELIVHWSNAVGRQARRKVLHYLRIATDRDTAAAAWESVIERSQDTLALLDAADLELQCDARLTLGTALRRLGKDSYGPELTAAADLARRLSDPSRLFRAAAAMMRPGEWIPEAGVIDIEIVAMCEDILLLVDDLDDPIRLRALAVLATNLAYDTDPERRLALVAEAQTRARGSSDLRLLGSTLVAELLSEVRPDALGRRQAVADEARRIGRATSDPDLLFTGTYYLMLEALERGEVEPATSFLEDLRSIAGRRRDFFSRYRVACLDAVIALAKCDPAAQERIDAAHLMAEGEPVDSFGALVLQTGTLAMCKGTLADILLPIAQAADMWDESWSRRWDFALAKAYLDTGDHELAGKTIRNNPEPSQDSFWLASCCQLAEVGWLLEFPDICAWVIEQLTPFRGRFVMVGGLAVTGLSSIALGQAYLGLHDLDTAEVLFREGLAQAESTNFPYFATNARRLLAQTILMTDPTSQEANLLLENVLGAAHKHDFRTEQQHAEALLGGGNDRSSS